MVHRMFFVAEIQRQIVLKFQIFQMNNFEDIIVGSWSGLNHKGPLKLRRYISPSSKQILTCDTDKDCL